MSTTALGRIASDFEEVPVPANGGDWRMAWHPPGRRPGRVKPHGANAFCVTGRRRNVVLVSTDGSRWGWPGGRPEPGESWEDTLRREMLEEACATGDRRAAARVRPVADASAAIEEGLVLVRSIWRAEVTLLPWRPAHEIPFRRVLPALRPGPAPVDGRRCRADLLPRRPGGGTRVGALASAGHPARPRSVRPRPSRRATDLNRSRRGLGVGQRHQPGCLAQPERRVISP